MASKEGIFVPFDWLNSMSRLGNEKTGAVLQATASIIQGTDLPEDLSLEIVTMAELLARDIEIMKESRKKDAERKAEERKANKEGTGEKKKSKSVQGNPRKSKEIQGNPRTSTDTLGQNGRVRGNPGIDVDVDVDVDGDVDVESQHNNPSDYHVCVSNARTQLNTDEINRLVESGIPMRYIEYFESRLKAGGYKCNDPASTCMSWWLQDMNKEEWKPGKKLFSSFDEDDVFNAGVERSMNGY